MTDRNRDDDLADRVEALEESLTTLREELREPPRGPLGLPRPPTPRELLRFTERHAIPTTIAVLEANVRALRLLQGALRMTDPERAVGEGASATRDRAERTGRAVLDRLDGALADIQAEIEAGDLPQNGEARDVVQDARRLSAEIRGQLGPDDAPETGGDGEEGSDDEDGSRTAVEIDVEDELRSIKDEVGGSADGAASDDERPDGDAPNGEPPDGDATDDDATAGDPGADDDR